MKYTYDVKETKLIIIRFANVKDDNIDTFDNLKSVLNQVKQITNNISNISNKPKICIDLKIIQHIFN